MLAQRIRILNYMIENGSITQLDAIREFSCTSLAARISDLRSSGIPISKCMVRSLNKYGEPVYFASYSIDDKL